MGGGAFTEMGKTEGKAGLEWNEQDMCLAISLKSPFKQRIQTDFGYTSAEFWEDVRAGDTIVKILSVRLVPEALGP